MKTLFYLVAILLVTSEALDPRVILLRAVVQGDKSISRLDASTEKCTTGKTRECTSCSSAKICLPTGIPIAMINCSSFSPSTPFCDTENGLCTAQQPASCGGTGVSFPCPSQDGIYPDPKDCAQFHYCMNGIDTPIVCPKNNVYDHDLGTCKLRKKLSDCVKFNCVKKEGEDILYPKDDRIWATCAGGDAYIMGRCKDYERYDVVKKKCSRVCRIVENQPIEGICNKYIRCADIGAGNLVPYEFPCPPGQNFDKEKKLCSVNALCPTSEDSDDEVDNNTEESSSEESTDNETVEEIENDESNTLSSRINNSGNQNSKNNVTNGKDEVNGNLVNGNGNVNNSNIGNIGSGNQDRVLSRIINNSGNNNANNSVENGDDNVNGNLINGNNNGNNQNSGNQEKGLISRINNSGNLNSENNVSNGDDQTNGNLVNGNDNSQNLNNGNVGSGNQRSLISRIINNSGDNNSGNELTNGNDSVDGDLINGNNNGNNLNSGNEEKALISRINNSGNENGGNNVANGNDKTNGNLVNGNDNSENSNNGNVGSGNWHRRLTPRIINNSGNNNNGNNLTNGDDNVDGNVINGNNNNNNDNSNNAVDKKGSNDSLTSQSTGNGSSPSDQAGNFEENETDDNKRTPPNLAEAIENLVEWLKNKITNRQKSGAEFPETVSAKAEVDLNISDPQAQEK